MVNFAKYSAFFALQQFYQKNVIVSIHKTWADKLLKLCKKEEKLRKLDTDEWSVQVIDLIPGGAKINTSK